VAPVKENNAVSRGVNILTYMAQKKKPVTLTEISKSLGIPKSSALDIMYTFVKKGFLEIDNPDLKTYKLGAKLYSIGVAAINNNDLQTISQRHLSKLSERTGKTIFMAVPRENRIIYITKIEGNSPVQSSATVGADNPMHLTGVGKAYLAAITDQEVLELCGRGPYERRTPQTLTTYEELIGDLQKIRKRGYSVDDREGVEYIYCFAAPIYNHEDKPIASISIVSIVDEIGDKERECYAKWIVETAMNISSGLGYTKDTLF